MQREDVDRMDWKAAWYALDADARALLDRAEKAEAERDVAFAAGLEAAAEAVLYLCRMKGMGNRTIDGPEAAHLIRNLTIKDRPDGR